MLDNFLGGHIDRIGQSLNLATTRQRVLTENMANINTPGYKRRDVDFTIAMDDAQEILRTRTALRGPGGLRQSQASIRTDGNSVDLEKEVYAIAETELRYNLLTDMAARYFSGLKNVIREGR